MLNFNSVFIPLKKVLLIFLVVCVSTHLFCQDTLDTLSFSPQFKHGIKYVLKTSVGTTYTGYVIEETKEFVVLEDRLNHAKTELRKNQLVNAVPLTQRKNYEDDLLGENYHAKNYLLSTSAFLFSANRASYTSHWFFSRKY